MKIYTKAGDGGQASALYGKKIWKDCQSMQVIGELDELNSSLGVSASELVSLNARETKEILDWIYKIQRDLFLAGAEISALQSGVIIDAKKITVKEVEELERVIDKWSEILPKLERFILPGGSAVGARLHHSRAICRRSERALVSLGKEMALRSELYQYLNRLGDFLFVAARYANSLAGGKEEVI